MLILASNSPRRKELLELTGWPFKLIAVEVNERHWPSEPPLAYVLRLACSKADAVAEMSPDAAVILAADTTVVDRGMILGKPADLSDAESMLRRLRGRTHLVYTGLAVIRVSDRLLRTSWCVSQVPMRNFSDAEMHAYIQTHDPLDKAGAYAIQHAGFHPVEKLDSCYANVVGLPLCHLIRTLQAWEIYPPDNVPSACQAALNYHCPVYPQVLQGVF